jgi:hypothetical protein
VPINASISRLTDMIWEKRKNGLQGVDAADLVLWKASTKQLADSS